MTSLRLYTVGHSNRSLEDFLTLLEAWGIRRLVDVRGVPRSRRFPHFSEAPLRQALADRGIEYVWEGPALGGRRPETAAAQRHGGLREPAFRAYAEHMGTPEADAARARLVAWGRETPTAFMCAEKDPAHCHRSFIADYLVAAGHEVVHLLDGQRSINHRLHPHARLEGQSLVYDGHAQASLDLG